VATHDQAVVAAADHVVELEHGAVRMRPSFGIAPPAPAPRGTRGVVPPESGGSAEILRVEEVMKSYGEGSRRVMAVRHVSLRLSRGEFVAIVGRSGSGKTTLLNVIAGWERPDSGEVTWPGTEEDRLLHWGIVAVVPQRLGLLDELTVAENVEYPARLMGSLGEHRASGDHLLRDLGIDHLAGRYPTETSIGEQQRTALARALSLRPTLLIADEPTGHQDASSTARVVAAIREATGSGTSALVATHDFRLAQHADRVLRMRDGRLVDS
jgi:putative ABC transport system ATP-binding protein